MLPTSHSPATALVIPSLGSETLAHCLRAVLRLQPAPDPVVVVLSGDGTAPPEAAGCELILSASRLGYAAAVNAGIRLLAGSRELIAVLNDDAEPPPDWLAVLGSALDAEPRLAAVQGTVTDAGGKLVDGRGIVFDCWALPIQVDRGRPARDEPTGIRDLLAVSGTAALMRTEALDQAELAEGTALDPRFGSYHEDLDLGLRLRRLGWRAGWIGGAPTRHLGSSSGRGLRWRHPWWLLANRWRALAGNLTPAATLRLLPRLLRGELRAVHTLVRSNPRTAPVALAVAGVLPLLIASGWRRRTPGPRLSSLPEDS